MCSSYVTCTKTHTHTHTHPGMSCMKFEVQPARLQRVWANVKLLLALCSSEHAPWSTPSCPRCSASAPSLRQLSVCPSVRPCVRQSSTGPGARRLPASGTGSAGPAGMDGEQVGHVVSEQVKQFAAEAGGSFRRSQTLLLLLLLLRLQASLLLRLAAANRNLQAEA